MLCLIMSNFYLAITNVKFGQVSRKAVNLVCTPLLHQHDAYRWWPPAIIFFTYNSSECMHVCMIKWTISEVHIYLLQGNPAVYIQQRHPGSSSMCDTHQSTFLAHTPLPSPLSPPVLLQGEHCHVCSWWLECIIDNPTSIVCSWTRGNYISCLSKVWTALHFQWTNSDLLVYCYTVYRALRGAWNDFYVNTSFMNSKTTRAGFTYFTSVCSVLAFKAARFFSPS